MGTPDVKIVDLDDHEPSDAEILSWYELMTAPDQLMWEYDPSWADEPRLPQVVIESFRTRREKQRGVNHPLWATCDGCVVGMIGVNCSDETPRRHCGELGYGVAAPFTRRGIGGRLLRAAIEKARHLGLRRLEANCFADNEASIALLRAHGFHEEGVQIKAIQKDGVLRDQSLFGLVL